MNTKEVRDFIYIPETDSTNNALKLMSENEYLPSGSIVYTDFQTAGRGQRGNSWESEANKNLLFSILLCNTDVPANISFVISEMMSLCVKYTLEKYISDITVKWPNDIYHKDKKIAGILIENTILQGKVSQSIAGIGINVNQVKFLSNAPNPVSMTQITNKTYNITTIIQDFHEIFTDQSKLISSKCFDLIHNEYLKHIYRKNVLHKYRDETGVFEAVIHDIEPAGCLVIKRIDGTFSRYAFKEISFLL